MRRLKDETIIQNIKDVGQALIENAEKIVNDYKYRERIYITCYVDEYESAPYISVNVDFVPENTVKRFENGTYDA